MTPEQFQDIFNHVFNRSNRVLFDKAREYAPGEDRLHNFKVAAALQGCTTKQALAGMLSKHIVSIFDMIRDEAYGASNPVETWEEKMGDAINYLILLYAQVFDDYNDVVTDTVKAMGSNQVITRIPRIDIDAKAL